MNSFMNELINNTNYTYTLNGGITHKTTKSDLMDMFAMGGAMRNRSDADIALMFEKAYEENPIYAMKCLFYLRDVRGGQGERRFFRICMHWLARTHTEAAARNLTFIPEFGRWDDLYVFIGTPLHQAALQIMKVQFDLDMDCITPSLLGKWLKSENTSSKESRRLAKITREAFGLSSKEYRKALSTLRARINVLERLMSENRWDEIEFDKIPSRAGMIYKNAFARHDLEREKYNKQTYAEFAKDSKTTVNAKALYPYECVAAAIEKMRPSYWGQRNQVAFDDTERLMINKYWDNLTDYFNGASLNAIAVVDTSGSMTCGYNGTKVEPIDVAISLGLYCAEHNHGPFANHYISFSSRPQLIRTAGIDFCDKVERIYATNLCENTNITATFDLLLETALHANKEDIPETVIIISDMEFDSAVSSWRYDSYISAHSIGTVMETMADKWAAHGLQIPRLVFWNVNAMQDNIPMTDNGRVSFVSGFSPSLFESIMSGKSGYDLMMETLNDERYACIQ